MFLVRANEKFVSGVNSNGSVDGRSGKKRTIGKPLKLPASRMSLLTSTGTGRLLAARAVPPLMTARGWERCWKRDWGRRGEVRWGGGRASRLRGGFASGSR